MRDPTYGTKLSKKARKPQRIANSTPRIVNHMLTSTPVKKLTAVFMTKYFFKSCMNPEKFAIVFSGSGRIDRSLDGSAIASTNTKRTIKIINKLSERIPPKLVNKRPKNCAAALGSIHSTVPSVCTSIPRSRI